MTQIISITAEAGARAGAGAGAGSDFTATQLPQSITFIGSGQVTALLAGLIALKNRELPEEEKVKISILGREGSESLAAIARSGIRLIMRDEDSSIAADEFTTITDNPDKIGPQDHVVLSIKATAWDDDPDEPDSSAKIIDNINKLKKSTTTVTWAQNGLTPWFTKSIARPDLRLSSVDPDKKIIQGIGENFIVGCTLNFGCSTARDRMGNPLYGIYHVSTERSKISVPLDRPDGKYTASLAQLHKIFSDAGIKVAAESMDITKELLLKWQVNAAVNGLSAITGLCVGDMLQRPGLLGIIRAVGIEINNIARALPGGYELRTPRDLEDRLNLNLSHTPSMESDLAHGKKLETNAIYQPAIDLAEAFGVKHPNVTHGILDILIKLVEARKAMSIEMARKTVDRDLSDLITMAKTRVRPPSPTPGTAPKPSLFSRPSTPSPSTSSAESSSTELEHPFNLDDYHKIEYSLPGDDAHKNFYARLKLSPEASLKPKALIEAMKDLRRKFYLDTPSSTKVYIDPYGKMRRNIKVDTERSDIIISNRAIFEQFKDWFKYKYKTDLKLKSRSSSSTSAVPDEHYK